MQIGICEDNKTHAEFMQSLVGEWAQKRKQHCNISVYPSAESFLFLKEDEKPFDVLLLDIQMDEMTGIELAKNLRMNNDDVIIVFITAVKDYVFDGYDVGALNYILKPVSKTKLFDCLDMVIKKMKSDDQYIIVNETKIMLKSIMYVEAQAHYISIFASDNVYTTKKPLKDFFDELSEDFIFCHRSYVVNLSAVKQIKKDEIIMDNGGAIPVSRSKYKEVNSMFIAYYKGGKSI